MVILLCEMRRRKPSRCETVQHAILCMRDKIDPRWFLSKIFRSTLDTTVRGALPNPEGLSEDEDNEWYKKVKRLSKNIKDLMTLGKLEGDLTWPDRITAWARTIVSPPLAQGGGPYCSGVVWQSDADRALRCNLGPPSQLVAILPSGSGESGYARLRGYAISPRARQTEPRRSGAAPRRGSVSSDEPAAKASLSAAGAPTGLGAAARRPDVIPPVHRLPEGTASGERARTGIVPRATMRPASDTILSHHSARHSDTSSGGIPPPYGLHIAGSEGHDVLAPFFCQTWETMVANFGAYAAWRHRQSPPLGIPADH